MSAAPEARAARVAERDAAHVGKADDRRAAFRQATCKCPPDKARFRLASRLLAS
jgi:hypothetical protein